MQLTQYQVDAFTSNLFKGNPAAVCPLQTWISDATMQAITAENNLSETAFFVANHLGEYDLRWFTPTQEVPLCGHATLAAAFILFEHLNHGNTPIIFNTRSGKLTVRREGDMIDMDFPVTQLTRTLTHAELQLLSNALGSPCQLAFADNANNVVVIFDHPQQVSRLTPHVAQLTKAPYPLVIATAAEEPHAAVQFVSRVFAPNIGIVEDPVTGFAHTLLAPYWAEKLNLLTLSGQQLSQRGGSVHCRVHGERVHLAGHAVLFSQATLYV